MKYFLTLLQLTLAGSIFVFGSGNPKTDNDYVKTVINLKQQKLKPGASGEILIYLKPKKGIHININPKIEVKLDSSGIIASTGNLVIPQAPKTSSLDPAKPIKQSFKLSHNIKPGRAILKGTLTYYYCSDAEGWCSKFKQPVELTIIVTP